MAEFGYVERLKMAKSAYCNYERWMLGGNKKDKWRLISRILGGNYLFIEHFELIVTTFCSLNCKGCSNSMPEYRRKGESYHLDLEYLKKELDSIIACVDRVYNLRILGGEPFLNPELGELLRYALSIEQIDYIDIVSNGTIMPSEEVMEVLSNSRISITFSDYGAESRNLPEVYERLTSNNIKCHRNPMEQWKSLGSYSKRDSKAGELIVQMKNCPFICKTYLKGNLHRCPRSAFGTDLGYYNYSDEYVSINPEKVQETRTAIAKLLYNTKYLKCCAHCLAATKYSTIITPGEQI